MWLDFYKINVLKMVKSNFTSSLLFVIESFSL